MRYLVSSYDVFNALGSVRAGVDVGGSCCSHSCAGHQCAGHADGPNYAAPKPADKPATQDMIA